MKLKNKLITGLCAIGITAFALGAASCGDNVTFENWQDTGAATAKLGEIYNVGDRSIKDTEGNIWYYDITVRNSKGEIAPLIAGEFEVLDAKGYTIEYAVEISNNNVRKRTVALNVTDAGKPHISVTMPTGFVGREYIVPQIVVTDLSGENITPTYKVYYGTGDTKTEVTLRNGKFNPAQKGTYSIDITAKDSAGNEAKVTKEFGVRAQAAENILENFDDPSSLVNSVNGSNQEWLETFQGRNGVVRIKGTEGDKAGFKFRFMGEKDIYRHTPFNAITVSLYVDVVHTEVNSGSADLYQTTTDASIATWYGASKGQWHELTITNFDDWNYLFNGATSERGGQLFWMWKNNKDIKDVYIDEIRFSATPQVEFQTSAKNNQAKIGDTVSVSASVPKDNRLDTWVAVKSPSGQKLKLNNGTFVASEIGYYTVTATVESAELSFYDTTDTIQILVLGNYVKVGDKFENSDIGKTFLLNDKHEVDTKYTLPTGVLYNPIEDTELPATVSAKVLRKGDEVAVENGAFTPDEQGVYQIVYTAVDGENNTYETVCLLYVVKSQLDENELITFATQDSVNNVCYGADGQGVGQTPQWLAEYQGRAGVIKLNDNAKEYGYTVRIDKTYDEIKDLAWDYVDIDVYLDGGDWLCYGLATNSSQDPINGSTPWKKGEWTTMSIHKSKLSSADGFLKAITSNIGGQLFWGWDLGNVYIDSIRLRTLDNVANDFATSGDAAECLNGGNGVGSAATWLAEYQGAQGVIKTNDGGEMGGYYIRTDRLTAEGLALLEWDYIEVKVWVTSASWVCFYNSSLDVELKAGEWNTLKISKSLIVTEMGNIQNFYSLFASDSGVQLFWGYDNMGDVYFDSIKLCKNA